MTRQVHDLATNSLARMSQLELKLVTIKAADKAQNKRYEKLEKSFHVVEDLLAKSEDATAKDKTALVSVLQCIHLRHSLKLTSRYSRKI